jgi:hypothetical protein
MSTNTKWNTQSKTDTVAFSSLIAAGMFLAWFAAAAPMADSNAALHESPALTQAVVQSADLANDPYIMATARRLIKDHG